MIPANPAHPAEEGLHWPPVMRSRLYLDPLLVVIDEEDRREARAARKAAEAALVPVKPCRDRYYRQAARLLAKEAARVEIQRIMKVQR